MSFKRLYRYVVLIKVSNKKLIRQLFLIELLV